MINPLILLLVLLTVPSSLLALVTTPEEQQEHLNRIITINAEANNLPEEERIRKLGHALWQLNQPSIFYHHEEQKQSLFSDTQEILLNTSGHAHYYRDRILEAKVKAFTDGQPEIEPEYGNYLKERDRSLQILALLPSVETMEVLMAFLDDHDRPFGKPADLGYFNHLSLQVIPILEQLLEDPVPRGTSWLDWRAEVRRGQRTFRFKGSDIRHNFVGPAPAKVTRPPKPLPSEASGHSPSDSGEQPNRGNTTPDPHPARNTIAALAGTLLLLSLLWWAYTKRSKNHL